MNIGTFLTGFMLKDP